MKSLLLLDLTGRVFLQKEKVFYWLVSAFFLTFFLPDMPVINNILIGATVVHSCYYNRVREKFALLRRRPAIWFMLLFYIWQIVSALQSQNRDEGLTMLGLRVPLLIFPVFIGLVYIREELKDRILLSYCFFTTIAAIACMLFAVGQYHRTGDVRLLYEDNLTEAIGRPSLYVAMAVNLALFIYVYLLQKKSFAIQYKGLVFLSIAFLVVFHFLCASRISILCLYTGFVCFTVWHYARAGRIWRGALLIGVLLAVAWLMIHFFPRTADRFRELKTANYRSHAGEQAGQGTTGDDRLTPKDSGRMSPTGAQGVTPAAADRVMPAGADRDRQGATGDDRVTPTVADRVTPNSDQLNGTTVRLSVWNCGWELFKRHPWTGVALGDKEAALMDIFRERNFDYALESRLNMHNTYLDVLCNLGVIGLVVFLLGYLFLPLAGSIASKDGLGLFIILAFGVAIFAESWPDRSVGCIMLGFFLSLVSAWERGIE